MLRAATRFAIVAGALALSDPSHAGDRKLEILFANLTPDAKSSEVSKTCVRQVEAILRADYTNVQRIGETALRKQAGKTQGEAFLDWPAAAMQPAKQRQGIDVESIDTVIAVDCRPESKRLEILVHPSDSAVARLQLNGVVLDKATVEWIADAALRRAWTGFSP